MEKIKMPTLGDMIVEEYMKPYGLSIYRLAKEIGVLMSRLQDIIHGRRKMTANTSLRLDTFFGLSQGFFLGLQYEIDIMAAKSAIQDELSSIKPIGNRTFECGVKGKRKTIVELLAKP